MRRIDQHDLKAMYGPVPQARLEALLSSLPRGEERPIVKKRISVAIVLATVLVLLVAGGVSAAANWDAVRFIYGKDKPELQGLIRQVDQQGQADGVTLNVDSALTDGKALSFVWTMELEEELLPLYIQLEELTVNGVRHDDVAGQGLSCFWVRPGESLRRGGQLLLLQEEAAGAETLCVEMKLGVYKPKQEVVFLPVEEHDKVDQLRAQGSMAAAPFASYPTRVMDEQGEPVMGELWQPEPEAAEGTACFERSELCFGFDVEAVKEARQIRTFTPEVRQLVREDHMILLEEAVQTELGIYATVEFVWDDTQQNAQELEQCYALWLNGPWDAFLSGWEAENNERIWLGEDGKLHQRRVAALVGYQNAVLSEVNTLQLHINKREDRMKVTEENVVRFFGQADGETEEQFERKLTPLQTVHDLPEGSVEIREIARDAYRALWATFVLTPGENTMEACKQLQAQLKATLVTEKGEPFAVRTWEPGTFTDVAIQQHEDGRLYLYISTGVRFIDDLPEEELAAVKLETGSETYLFPFHMYGE